MPFLTTYLQVGRMWLRAFSAWVGVAAAASAEHGVRGAECNPQQTRGQHEAGDRQVGSGGNAAAQQQCRVAATSWPATHNASCQFLTNSAARLIIIIVIIGGRVLSSMAKPYARVHLGHISESRSAPDGCQLVGWAANFTFESANRPRHSLITICITTQS